MSTLKSPITEEEKIKIWEKKAIEAQSWYCNLLGDRYWEKYTNGKNDTIHLQNKIGYILFGLPKDESSVGNSNIPKQNSNGPQEESRNVNYDIKDVNSEKSLNYSREEFESKDGIDFNQSERNSLDLISFLDGIKTFDKDDKTNMSQVSQVKLSNSEFLDIINKTDFVIDSSKPDDLNDNISEIISFIFGLTSDENIVPNLKQISEDNISEDDEDDLEPSEYDADSGHSCSGEFSKYSGSALAASGYQNNAEASASPNISETNDSLYCPEGSGSAYASEASVSSNSIKDDEDDSYNMFYSDPTQIKQIHELITVIKKCIDDGNESKDIHIGFIFVVARIKISETEDSIAEFPVIRVFNEKNKNIPYFIDCTGRCYKNWIDFLDDNCFPSCTYCYPKNGFYSRDCDDKVILEFGSSPESKFLRKFNKVGDITSNIAGLGCGVVILASVAVPVAAPLVIGAAATSVSAGIWTTARSVYQLVDRKLHKQKLTDKDARGCWLNLATGVLGVASVGALRYTQYLAKNGKVLGKVASLVVNGIEVSNTGMSSVSIVHQLYNIYENKEITRGDVAGLVVSLLFFCNTAVKFKTAKTLLVEAQGDIIKGVEAQLSRRQRNAFKSVVKATRSMSGSIAEGNANVIKTINNVQDLRSYMADLSRATRVANKTKSTLSFLEDGSGKLKLNKKITVEPEIVNSMSNKSKYKLFSSSKKFSQSGRFKKGFQRDMNNISRKENLAFTKSTLEFQRKVNIKTTQEFKQNGKAIFSNIKQNDVKNIVGFFKNDKDIQKIKPSIVIELKKEKCNNILILFEIVINVINKLGSVEGKEMYDNLMEYYEKNLREPFEKIVQSTIDVSIRIMSDILDNKNLKIFRHSFHRKINSNSFTSWDYFETYFKMLWNKVPERQSVIQISQKVGWLFIISGHLKVHSIFIVVVRMDKDFEKVQLVAFMKGEP